MKRTKAAPGWDIDAESPRADVAQSSSSPLRYRMMRVFVWACVVLMPFALLAIVGVATGRSIPAQISSPAAVTSSPGRAAATMALTDWLASKPAPLPGGRVLAWEGASVVPVTTTVDANGKDVTPAVRYISEVNTFLLADPFGTYRASVQVAVDPRGGASVIGTPSLERVAVAAADGWSSNAMWPGLATSGVTVTDSLTKSVSAWAGAYTAGDSDGLRIAVGDPDGSKLYVPLSNVTVRKVRIVGAAYPNPQDKSRILARVEADLVWPGVEVTDGTTIKPTTFDVLVERADTGAPLVTAWGAPGTGPLLKRYGNAIDSAGRVLTPEQKPAAAEPTPSATPSQGG